MTNAGTGPAGPEGEKRATPAKREWVVDALCEAYAQDQLGLEELERRLELELRALLAEANRVRSELELPALLAHLVLAPGTGPTLPAVLGGLEDRSEYRSSQNPNEPMLKIRGFAVMAGIEIDVRLPGETARQAKGRRRKARRAKPPIVPGGG